MVEKLLVWTRVIHTDANKDNFFCAGFSPKKKSSPPPPPPTHTHTPTHIPACAVVRVSIVTSEGLPEGEGFFSRLSGGQKTEEKSVRVPSGMGDMKEGEPGQGG